MERVRDRLGRGVRGGATRWLRPAGAALLGVAVGVGVALALQGPPDPPPAGSAPVATRAPEAVRAAAPMPTGPVAAAPATSAAPADRVLLAWTPGRLPGGLAGRVGRVRGVRAVTVVRGGLLGLAGSVDAEGRPVDRPRPGTTVPAGDDRVRPGHLSGPAARLGQRRLRPAASRGGPAGSDLGPAAPPGAGGQAPGRSRSRAGRDQALADHRRGGRRRPGRCGRGRGHHGRSQGGRDHPGPVPAARLPRRPGRGRRRGTSHPAGAAPGPAARPRRDAVLPGR